MRSAHDLEMAIKRKMQNGDLGVVQEGTALALLIEAVADEIHTELVNLTSGDLDYKLSTLQADVEVLKTKPYNTQEIADELWTRLNAKREEEKDAFIRDLEKL